MSVPTPFAVTMRLAALCRQRADGREPAVAIALGRLASCLDHEPIVDDELAERLQQLGERMAAGAFPDEGFWQRAEAGAYADCWHMLRRLDA